MSALSVQELALRYYVEPAAAYVRSCLPDLDAGSDELTVSAGLAHPLRLHRFKRVRVLPRVRKVIGTLRGLDPDDLLDIGSGRGAALWPMLEAFPDLPITCVDHDQERARQLGAVASGGIKRLTAHPMDVTSLTLDDGAVDVVTALEVLEHVPDVSAAVEELVRVGRRFAIVTVPSRPDDNPGHIHLLSADRLQRLFKNAGANRVDIDAVRNHLAVVVKLS